MTSRKPPSDTVIHSLGSTWSQLDLGEAFDVDTLAMLSDLDPTGARGVVSEVLTLLDVSLEPMLERLERFRNAGAIADIRFEAHKMKSAAAQLGALRLAAACSDVLKRIAAGPPFREDLRGGDLAALLDAVVTETIRVQRQLRRLLGR